MTVLGGVQPDNIYARQTRDLIAEPSGVTGWKGPYLPYNIGTDTNFMILPETSSQEFYVNIVSSNGSDWNNWHDGVCNSQPNCYIWIYIWDFDDSYIQTMKKVDEIVDNGDGESKGNIRYFHYSEGHNNLYLKYAPLQ